LSFFKAGIGIAYGALVNLVSNYRDKNDEVNHAIAAMVAFPATAVYAKSNADLIRLMDCCSS
jgi:hypothetical protein